MALRSLFKRKEDARGAEAPDAVAQARQRARRRLIGATVLLGVGVVGFPLVFETQPRPIPVDIPIEIPRKETAAPVAMPPARVPSVTAALPEAPVEASVAAASANAAPSPASAKAESKPEPRAAPEAKSDGARAQALLEGKPASAGSANTGGLRMVVQVGAYTDPDKLREARQKVEKLGFKTYTQVIEVDGAKRTRVRIGPFAARDEADKAAARIKSAGLPAAILVL